MWIHPPLKIVSNKCTISRQVKKYWSTWCLFYSARFKHTLSMLFLLFTLCESCLCFNSLPVRQFGVSPDWITSAGMIADVGTTCFSDQTLTNIVFGLRCDRLASWCHRSHDDAWADFVCCWRFESWSFDLTSQRSRMNFHSEILYIITVRLILSTMPPSCCRVFSLYVVVRRSAP